MTIELLNALTKWKPVKIKATIIGQMPEIANQVCDWMVVTSPAALPKNCDSLGGRGGVIGFVGHPSSMKETRVG